MLEIFRGSDALGKKIVFKRKKDILISPPVHVGSGAVGQLDEELDVDPGLGALAPAELQPQFALLHIWGQLIKEPCKNVVCFKHTCRYRDLTEAKKSEVKSKSFYMVVGFENM